jgi:hypothetical protein
VTSELAQPVGGRAPHPLLGEARQDPCGLPTRIADALHTYGALVIAPNRPRMHAVLRADVLHRAQRPADGRAAALLSGIDPGLRRQTGTLTADTLRDEHRDLAVDGRG